MCPVTQTSQLLFLSTFDLKDNDTFLKLWTIQDFCETQCSRSECKEKEVVTTTESGHYDESYIFWDYQVSSQISFKITSSAALPFVEFFIYILGSISTWTGLSIIACNPVVIAKYSANFLKSRNLESNTRKQYQNIMTAVKKRRQRMHRSYQTRQSSYTRLNVQKLKFSFRKIQFLCFKLA